MSTRFERQTELFPAENGAKKNRNFDAAESTLTQPYIGCAGWNLARSVQASFPAQGTHLQRYSSILPAVEINSSFYRPHRAATYARWRDSVPESFRFSVKMPRSITHHLRLKSPRAELMQFLDAACNLQHKLGCLLVQLPPSLEFTPSIAVPFFDELRSLIETDIACEPRHATWAVNEADQLFARLRITRVAADPPAISMHGPAPATDMVYIRLHGSPVIYHSAYSDEYLARIAGELADHLSLGQRAWCILDNTADGASIPNALFLTKQLKAGEKIYLQE